MKRTPFLLRLAPIAMIAVISIGSSDFAKADDLKFSDLKKDLTIEKTPVDAASLSFAPALDKVMPAVVTISSSKSVEAAANPGMQQQQELFRRMFPDMPREFFDRHGGNGGPERRQQGLGSGVIITADGYILTNNHVVAGADEIKVKLSDSKLEYTAKLIGADPKTDVAIIKIDADDLATITIGDSSKVRIGDVALAVGNPNGLEQTATLGIISAVGRNDIGVTNGGFENFIQTDAAINRGNSGGALVDAEGRLIGINTAIQSNFGGGSIGIGFAIPSNMALNIVQRLVDGGGVVPRGFLGVYLKELDTKFAKALGREDVDGVIVTEVGAETPASDAGMKSGDLIVGYNGADVDDVQKLRLDISNTAPGTKVTFDVVRNGKDRTLDVVLGDLETGVGALASNTRGVRPPAQDQFIEGVRVKDIDDESRKALQLDDAVTGVLVESVKDNSPAAEAGLRPGTIITQVDQTDVTSVEEATSLIEQFEGDVLLLQIYVSGRRDILAVPLAE
ncbi:MAG: Do family serine endopeptidase [Verrucomicrobiota bacterium]